MLTFPLFFAKIVYALALFVFKEPAMFWRLFFICTLILSIIGLKFVS